MKRKMRDRPHDEVMIENYRADPVYAAHLLNKVLNDGDTDEIRYYLKMMNVAFGEGSGHPKDIAGLLSVIHAMGCRLSVAPEPSKPRKRTKAVSAKVTKLLPASRPRARRSAAVAIA